MKETLGWDISQGPRRGALTRAQISRLLTPVREDRIETKNRMAYVPQHEVRAELLRTFGPGNVEHTMHTPELIYETRIEKGEPQYPTKGDGKPYYVACYMVGCNLRVYGYDGGLVYDCTEYHVEENAPLPNRGEAHAMAVTSAQSYALRRAALGLGDAMGLHLYDGGSTSPLVRGTLALRDDPDAPLYAPRTLQDVATGDTATPPENGAQPTTGRGAQALSQGFAKSAGQ